MRQKNFETCAKCERNQWIYQFHFSLWTHRYAGFCFFLISKSFIEVFSFCTEISASQWTHCLMLVRYFILIYTFFVHSSDVCNVNIPYCITLNNNNNNNNRNQPNRILALCLSFKETRILILSASCIWCRRE